jgi:hypothetical protein
LQGGYSWFENDFANYEASHFDIQGRANIWLAPQFSVQVDAWDEELYFNTPTNDISIYGAAMHLSLRDPSSYLLGALISIGESFNIGYASAGANGQVYLGNTTLYGQAGYAWDRDGIGQSAPYVHLVARQFLNPDVMLEGQVGWADVDFGGGGSDLWRWAARIEAKVPQAPLSVYAEYQGMSFDGNGNSENAIVGGIRLLSMPTLQANDREGATLVDYNPLFGYPIFRD